MFRSVATAGLTVLLTSGSLLGQTTQPATPPATEKNAAPTTRPSAAEAVTTGESRDTGPAITPQQLRKEQAAMLEKALEQLKAEAEALDKFEDTAPKLIFTRPHPAIAQWGADMAVPCLDRMMAKPLTREAKGSDYRDTYIRWHLMWVVKKASQEERERTGPRLVKLIKALPDGLSAPGKEEYRYEPHDAWNKYVNLVHSGDVVVGYPPFQQVLNAPASYPHLSPEKVAEVKKNLEEAEAMKNSNAFKIITDPNAIKWNARVRELNYLVRQYRGELIYSLLLTGDPEMAKLVMSEIDRQASIKSGTAFDLMAFVYLAAFDGALNLYEQKTLTELSAKLEASARRMEGYMNYSGVPRNFADYAFHMIYMLRDGGGFIDPKEAERLRSTSR
jgi:hypothetical protein